MRCRCQLESGRPDFTLAPGLASTPYFRMTHFNGKPVWHCSVSRKGRLDTLRDLAVAGGLLEAVLMGAGEGEIMQEMGRGVLHGRRYLTADESVRVGGAVDVRGTDEHVRRFEMVRAYVPAGWVEAIGERP